MRRQGMGWGTARRIALLAFGFMIGSGSVLPHDAIAQAPYAPPRFLVDTPTAGLVPAGAFETRVQVFPGGGVEAWVDIGIADWLALGGGYGGLKIIGDGDPDWYPEPGFELKIRVLEEGWTLPALALGIDTQGAGYWDESRDRFQFKSRGVYVVASKNYAWLGDLTFHGGVSRSLEEEDDGDPTPFAGIEKSVTDSWRLALEYDLGANDNREDGVYGRGRGYLNAALSWNMAAGMEIRLVVRDMLDNSEAVDPAFTDVIADEGWGRELSFSYLESF